MWHNYLILFFSFCCICLRIIRPTITAAVYLKTFLDLNYLILMT